MTESVKYTDEELETRIFCVSMCLASASTPKARAKYWAELKALKQQHDERKHGPFA